ncbi:MAG: hypothetical protein Ct9H300mP23_06790 [Nitrospinota bacterium]|nr:MAG: hypothetical protein Ct9H300mP23_06790 [Nitrospinota bacterium]
MRGWKQSALGQAQEHLSLCNMCRVINTPLAIQPDNIEMSFMLKQESS